MTFLVVSLALLLFFSFLLIKAVELLVGSLNRLSQISRISQFGLTSFILALATSLPELFVGITAALENRPELSLGNVLGSNIVDLSLVIGGAAVVGGSLGVAGSFFYKDLFYVFLAGTFPLVLLLDNSLSRVEGLLLIAVYGIYNFTVLKKSHPTREHLNFKKFFQRLNQKHANHHLAWIFVAAAILIFSADGIIKTSVLIAQSFNLPLMIVGLFLVAVGTSLPELSFEIGAVRKGQVGMAFGDLLGSVVANSTLILGITALINPIILDGGFKIYFWATIAFLVVFFCFWFFVRTKKKLERWEGLLLILIYFIFILFEFWRLQDKTPGIFLME